MTATDQPRLDHDARCASWNSNDPALCDCRDEHGHAPRTPWIEGGTWLAFDTETSGVDVTSDRLVTATVAVIRPGAAPQIRSWLADPGVDIPEAAQAVHGISTEHARANGLPAAQVVAEVEAALLDLWGPDRPLCAYNASFDLSLLDAELRRHHGRPLRIAGPVIDPLVIDKHLDKWRRGSRKLVDVCAHYRVKLDGAHDATEDALAAARVAWRIAKTRPEIGSAALADLHVQQARWFGEQQVSFANYLRRKVVPTVEADERQAVLDRADAVEAAAGGWPLRTGA